MTAMIWISSVERSGCEEMWLEIFPAYSEKIAYRVEFFGDEIDRITEIDTLTGEVLNVIGHVAIFPASHYVVSKENMERAIGEIEEELEQQMSLF